jgi:hypothetical protein
MKTFQRVMLSAFLLSLPLILPIAARAQSTNFQKTVTNLIAPITATVNCNIITIIENSTSPTAFYTLYDNSIPASANVPINKNVGQSITIFSAGYKPGQVVAYIVATTAGPFTFLVQQQNLPLTYPIIPTKPTDWQFASVTLNSAQILALGETPVQLISAHGLNTQVVLHNIMFDYIHNTADFATLDVGTVCAYYAGMTTLGEGACGVAFPGGAFSPSGLIDQGFSQVVGGPGGLTTGYTTVVPVSQVANEPLLLIMPLGLFDCAVVTHATIGNAAGTGYAVNDFVTITGLSGPSPNGIVEITGIGAGGSVTGFSLMPYGNGECDQPAGTSTNTTTSPLTGIGTGLTVNTTAIIPGDGTLQISTWYSVVPVN